MNIICIGTLDKFSRFYLKLKKELSKTKQTNLSIYSIHLSGFLYTLVRLKFSSWISVKSWFIVIKNKKKYINILKQNDIYRDIKFDELIKYHLTLNKNSSKQKLLLQSLAYIDIFESIVLRKKPNLFILIGDSKLSIETCIAIAKKYNIKAYFIEQGPFNTTVFDEKGVNANASIRGYKSISSELVSKKELYKIQTILNTKSSLKYNRSPIYRGIDLFFDTFFSKTYFYPPDLKYTDTFKLLKKTNSTVSIKTSNDKNINVFLLILQIPMDVNMIYHSPNFKTHLDIVHAVHKNLPKKSKLILREHPLYKNKYEEELYQYCKTNKIEFNHSKSISNSLNSADIVIVNNSTVGIEAIASLKTVVVLGNSYYDQSDICIKYIPNTKLKETLKKALDYKVNENKVNDFLKEFLLNYLILGFITDKNLIAINRIKNKIINFNKN